MVLVSLAVQVLCCKPCRAADITFAGRQTKAPSKPHPEQLCQVVFQGRAVQSAAECGVEVRLPVVVPQPLLPV